MNIVFLDAHSTTKVDNQVLDAMTPYYLEQYANPNSVHFFGMKSRLAVIKAKKIIAKIINADPEQIFFTSGATESNNLAIKGWCKNQKDEKLLIVTSSIEHLSIINAVKSLLDEKHIVQHIVGVCDDGQLQELPDLSNLPYKKICSIHAANNEIGTVYNLSSIGSWCKENKIFFHTDATQAIGKVKIDVEESHIDALSFSAHKINGPKGVGVLYLRDHNSIKALIDGGLQDTIRSGTTNVPGVVGTAKALEIHEAFDWKQISKLRDHMLDLLTAGIPDLIINGTLKSRLPNNLNISIPGIPSEILIKGMKDIVISAGSACQSGESEPSFVLKNINGKHPECAIRIGLHKDSNIDEINYASKRIIEIVKLVRK